MSVGSNNLPARIYENPQDLDDWLAAEMLTYGVTPEIEVFDVSHIFKAHQMWQPRQIAARPYLQFVMGVRNAMPADRDVFEFYIRTVRRLSGEDTPWSAAGRGPSRSVRNDR